MNSRLLLSAALILTAVRRSASFRPGNSRARTPTARRSTPVESLYTSLKESAKHQDPDLARIAVLTDALLVHEVLDDHSAWRVRPRAESSESECEAVHELLGAVLTPAAVVEALVAAAGRGDLKAALATFGAPRTAARWVAAEAAAGHLLRSLSHDGARGVVARSAEVSAERFVAVVRVDGAEDDSSRAAAASTMRRPLRANEFLLVLGLEGCGGAEPGGSRRWGVEALLPISEGTPAGVRDGGWHVWG